MNIRNGILITIALYVASLFVFELTQIDLIIQDKLYDFTINAWVLSKKAELPKFFLYDGIKVFYYFLGAVGAFFWAWSYRAKASEKIKSFREPLYVFCLSMALVPITTASLKHTTNVYCPNAIERYGGDKPYAKLFEPYPEGFKQERISQCYPAGHASGGFALMALFFVPASKKLRYAGLAAGLAFGWITGVYKMAIGDHYLSHTVATMLIAWTVILTVKASAIKLFHPETDVKFARMLAIVLILTAILFFVSRMNKTIKHHFVKKTLAAPAAQSKEPVNKTLTGR